MDRHTHKGKTYTSDKHTCLKKSVKFFAYLLRFGKRDGHVWLTFAPYLDCLSLSFLHLANQVSGLREREREGGREREKEREREGGRREEGREGGRVRERGKYMYYTCSW